MDNQTDSQQLKPIQSNCGEFIYVPTFQYLSYWSGKIEAISFLLVGLQIEVKEISIFTNKSGEELKFFQICQPPKTSSAKDWEFEKFIDFLIETDTPFLAKKWIHGWNYPSCDPDDFLRKDEDGYYWEKLAHFGYSWKLPYEAKEYDIEGVKKKYWHIDPRHNSGPYYERDLKNGWVRAWPLPYYYDNLEKTLKISANRLYSRLPEIKEAGFKDAIDYDRYSVIRYKTYNKIVVNFYAFKDETDNYTSGCHFDYLLKSRDLDELTGKMWIIAEKLPYTYQRKKRILRVKTKQKSQRDEGWMNAVKLPFKIQKDDSLTVTTNIRNYWEKPVPIEGKIVDGFKEWDGRCLKRYHVNYTELKKIKRYRDHLKNGGEPLEAIGCYNCRDVRSSRVPFYDARDFME